MRSRIIDQLRAEIPNLDPNGIMAKVCNTLDAQLDAFEAEITKRVFEAYTQPTMSDGTFYEEIPANEVCPGDVVTHVQDGKVWRPVTKANGDPSAGHLISRDDTYDVFGYYLEPDGSQSPTESYLFALDYSHKLRVITLEQLMDSLKPVVVAPVATTIAPAKEWNAKCLRCGRGVYNGLFSQEHDGPCK